MSLLKTGVEISNVSIKHGYKNSISLKVNTQDEIRIRNVKVQKGRFGWEYQYSPLDEEWLETLSDRVKQKAKLILDEYDLSAFDLLNKKYGKFRAKESSYNPPQFIGLNKLNEDKVNVVDMICKMKITKFKNNLYFSFMPLCYKFVEFQDKQQFYQKKEKKFDFSDDDDNNTEDDNSVNQVEIEIEDSGDENI